MVYTYIYVCKILSTMTNSHHSQCWYRMQVPPVGPSWEELPSSWTCQEHSHLHSLMPGLALPHHCNKKQVLMISNTALTSLGCLYNLTVMEFWKMTNSTQSITFTYSPGEAGLKIQHVIGSLYSCFTRWFPWSLPLASTFHTVKAPAYQWMKPCSSTITNVNFEMFVTTYSWSMSWLYYPAIMTI